MLCFKNDHQADASETHDTAEKGHVFGSHQPAQGPNTDQFRKINHQ